MTLTHRLIMLVMIITLQGCQQDEQPFEPPVRGVKTVTITSTSNTSVRRFPSVLIPADTTALAFEIDGRLGKNDLEVGQRVKQGEALLMLDQKALKLAVDETKAALSQARATAKNAASNYERQQALYDKRIISKATIDQANADMLATKARVEQTIKQLDTAKDRLKKSVLKAPYDGIINAVSVDSWATIDSGQVIARLYNPDQFEAQFAVSWDLVNRLSVGKSVIIRSADDPTVTLHAVITELGERADKVSSYPVIVTLQENSPRLKAGMAIEIAVEVNISKTPGFALPLSALSMEDDFPATITGENSVDGVMYRYDDETQTMQRRQVSIAGIRDNLVFVSHGLEPGDKIAVAGVAFIREGQRVKLLPSTDSSHLLPQSLRR